jgi:uncharacterized protein (TIGR02646 family)
MVVFCETEGGTGLIPVAPQVEPATFAAKVRNPGRTFLRSYQRPTRDDFKKAPYWNQCLGDLRSAYRSVCAYCCLYVPMESSVDHFLPKSQYPTLAYEWNNFRLAHSKINSYKANNVGVLDPFHIQPGWFILDFANCHVKPNPATPQAVQQKVAYTIGVLRLNTDDSLVQFRFSLVRNYSKDFVTMDFLDVHYPFIAIELKRQGIQHTIKGTIP